MLRGALRAPVIGLLLAFLAGPSVRGAEDLPVSLRPRSPSQGQMFLLEVEGARPGDRLSATFRGRSLRFFLDERQRLRALGAVELDCPPGAHELSLQLERPEGGILKRRIPIQIQAGRFEDQELRVKRRYVKPPKRFRARIDKERRAMQKLSEAPVTSRAWSGDFVWPRRDTITSAFGLRRVFNGELQSRHRGLDIDGRRGSPVASMGAGRVVMVARRYYSGGTVVVDHGLRLFSLYFHLRNIPVEEGQRVEAGEKIGTVGRSGRATGPHLHLSVKIEGVYVDPLQVLNFDFSGESS